MSTLAIEMLTPEKVTQLWPELEPMLQPACDAHPIAKDELTTKDIYVMALMDLCAVFVCTRDGQPTLALVFQFHTSNGIKCADLIALGGKDLLRFKSAYWKLVLDWLRANEVKFLDAYASERMAKIYMSKFGFDKSCMYVRMTL